ncbi:MAG: 6-phosphofructokinase [Bacteroidetes bacterium HGW-Bacteroidetes-21]|jgi:6-phosphofructokinase 1|nr:MAG: 6-phosphofructokinase [Bacteroidetes bacterium HGW-Bacteroidetes-21]
METKKRLKIGILTAGGDCPGINAAIRGVAKTAILEYGMEVIGISSGFAGLINKEYIALNETHVSGILTLGGTILGTSREKPFGKKQLQDAIDRPKLIKEHYADLKLDCLVCIGGNGTMRTAGMLSQQGLNIIGIPKTIDNDVWGTDVTFGFDSAVNIATEAIDRLHTTANSHKRIMIIEVMGHNAGWIALHSGIAGGGDLILLPEIPYQEDVMLKYLDERATIRKGYSIVVVAEGIEKPKKEKAGEYISKLIGDKLGYETRVTVLGYIQRGGTPSPTDRILATRYGTYAAELISEGQFGRMVAIHENKITSIPIAETEGKTRLIPPDYSLIAKARKMGTCFGDTLPTNVTVL